jgi:transposase
MSKYSFEFKKNVVNAYLNGEGGYCYLAKKFGIPSKSRVKLWVDNYNTFGDEGLKRSRENDFYSFEKKLSVVELYLSSEISYQDLALQEGITNPSMITNWVNRFRISGPDALRPHKKGRKKALDKTQKNINVQPCEETVVDTSVEHVKELEDELLKLRIENAFLKELRRLRLEDEAKMRERRSSSTVSEENSN